MNANGQYHMQEISNISQNLTKSVMANIYIWKIGYDQNPLTLNFQPIRACCSHFGVWICNFAKDEMSPNTKITFRFTFTSKNFGSHWLSNFREKPRRFYVNGTLWTGKNSSILAITRVWIRSTVFCIKVYIYESFMVNRYYKFLKCKISNHI